jgi:pilus assembly protein CpaC
MNTLSPGPIKATSSTGMRTLAPIFSNPMRKLWLGAALGGLAFFAQGQVPLPMPALAPAQKPRPAKVMPPQQVALVGPVVAAGATTVGDPRELIIGKSQLLHMNSPIERISVGNPSIADVSLITPHDLYLLGKNYGTTNIMVWQKGGDTVVMDVNVSIDAQRMEQKLKDLLPEEKGIRVQPAADSVILTGTVSSAMKARYAEEIADAFVRDINKTLVLPVTAGDAKAKAGAAISVGGTDSAVRNGGAKVVNLLLVTQPQQVMLEVKIAEVSKTLIDKLGAKVAVNRSGSNGADVFSLTSNFLSGGGGLLEALNVGRNALSIDAQKDDGLVRVLAEPNIMAISGQSASFLSGGKIFIPVNRTTDAGVTTITLEEKEFGIGVRFTPTALDGTRINLKLMSEVSELSQTGSPFLTVNNIVSILPSMSLRKVDTTVQLNDGQSFVIAGLIKNNTTAAIKRVPGLGEIPILGALFRSTEFQKDQTELLFVITPRLVKPLAEVPVLPTSNHVEPSRADVLLNGRIESAAPAPAPVVVTP